MTAWKTTYLECDGCQTEYDAHEPTAAEVRTHARKDGWLVSASGGRDYCPKCHLRR